MTTQKSQKSKIKPIKRRNSPAKPEPHIKREPVAEKDVQLVAGKGTDKHGGGEGGQYWHIYVNEQRAGYIFINIISNEFLGEHPSIQIFLNQASRGKQIGRVAYRLACEKSNYDLIYAHMRKSNIASIRAAEEAGFVVVEKKGMPQYSMKWLRSKT